MPIQKVKGGFKFGATGKVFKTKAQAARQGRAIKAEKAAKDLFYQLLTKYANGGPRGRVSPFWLEILRKDRN